MNILTVEVKPEYHDLMVDLPQMPDDIWQVGHQEYHEDHGYIEISFDGEKLTGEVVDFLNNNPNIISWKV